jgi:hypothetical protein
MNSQRTEGLTQELVLVIHGVGDPMPGETLSLFARSIATYGEPLEEKPKILWLADRNTTSNQISTFATHVRHVEMKDRHLSFAEIFWGDLSAVRRGVLGAFLGLIEILFGIRYIAFVAAYQRGLGATCLRKIGLLCTSILHGPVLALTAFLAMLTIALTLNRVIWPTSEGLIWTRLVLTAVVGIAVTIGGLGGSLSKTSGVRHFWNWFQLVATFVAGLAFVKQLWLDQRYPEINCGGHVDQELVWFCGVLVMMLGLLWLVQMLMVLALGISWLVAVFSPGSNRTALHVGFLLPALAVGFWGLALPMIWLTAASSLEKFIKLTEFNSLFTGATPLLGVQFVMAIVVIISAAIVLLKFVYWRHMVQQLKNFDGLEPPRLIVHTGLQFAMAVTTLLGVSLVARISILQFSGKTYSDIWGGQILAEANKYAISLLLPVGLVTFMLFQHLRPILDIVLDVMNHFFFRKTRFSDVVDGDEFDIQDATIDAGTLYFSRRDAIHVRVKKTLAHFRDTLKGRPRLTVISHSQGTMIAIEILNDPELAWLNSTFSSVRLVTMGSPFSHLYQHYFSHLYPKLSEPHWRPIHARLDRWINIFRADDFVGTRIDFSNLPAENKYSNYPVGLHGHLNYWVDRDVLEVLHSELFNDEVEQGIQKRQAA